MSHFSFCKMSQCRPTFFIVKHKTAHKYAAKVLFRYTQRTVQYCKPGDTVVLTNHIYNFSLLFGGESVCSSSWFWRVVWGMNVRPLSRSDCCGGVRWKVCGDGGVVMAGGGGRGGEADGVC